MVGQLARAGTGCFDLVLDSEKCKLGMEIQTNAVGMGFGMNSGFFNDIMSSPATSSMSPSSTPWNSATTPAYAGEWSPMMNSAMTPGVAFSPAGVASDTCFSPAYR